MSKDNFCKTCECKCRTDKIYTYKFRVELMPDVTKFISRFIIVTAGDIINLVIDAKKFQLGCSVELTTHSTLKTVSDVLSSCSNLHIAVETIQPIELYTGVRKN